MEISIGQDYTVETIVDKQKTALSIGSGTLDVLATPAVAALMEEAAWKLVAPYLPDGITTVGTKISIDHIRATAEGKKITAKAVLIEMTDRKYVFEVSVSDEKGIAAKGIHERFTVKADRFMEKARS